MPKMKKIEAPEGNFWNVKNAEPGSFIEGIYIESKEKTFAPSEKNPHGGKGLNHVIFTAPDTYAIASVIVEVNGTGQLNYLLKQASAGDYLRITYKGMKLITTGAQAGTEAHNFDMELAEDQQDRECVELREQAMHYATGGQQQLDVFGGVAGNQIPF